MIKIQLPNLSSARSVYAQVRPFRKEGIRIEQESIGGKHFVHNYGHGGAGISLAYGSAYICAEKLVGKDRRERGCAVVGGGIMGLMTAIQLARRGQRVTVYSEKYSRGGERDNTKCITSQISPGLWAPYWYYNNDMVKHQLLARLSFGYYKDCMKSGRYSAFRDYYTYDRKFITHPQYALSFPDFIRETFERVKVCFREGGQEEEFIRYKTISVNVEMLLDQLQEQARLRGINLVTKKFDSLEDMLELPEQHIANCTGVAAGKLFGDESVEGWRGHLLEFENNNPSKLNYCLRIQDVGLTGNIHVQSLDIYCHNHRILVGVSVEVGKTQGQVVKDIGEAIHKMALDFVERKTSIKPKL